MDGDLRDFFPRAKKSSISLYRHQKEFFQTFLCVTKYFQVAIKHSKVS